MGRVVCVFDQLENSLDWPTCSDTYLSGQMRKECVEMFVISFVETFRLRGLSLSFFFFLRQLKWRKALPIQLLSLLFIKLLSCSRALWPSHIGSDRIVSSFRGRARPSLLCPWCLGK